MMSNEYNNYSEYTDFYPDDMEDEIEAPADTIERYENDENDEQLQKTSKDSTDDVIFEDVIKKQTNIIPEKVDYHALFVRIMDDYHSGNPTRKNKATLDAIEALNGIIFLIIRRRYPTYAPRYIADLVQEGKIGIIKGLEKYDPDLSMPSTFFHSYIKHEIQNFINENINKTTAHYSSNIRKINKAIAYFEDKQIPYTIADLSIRTRLSTESIEQALSIRKHADEMHYDGCTDAFLAQNFQSSKIGSPENELIEEEETSTIQNALLENLTAQEIKVINLWYGMDGAQPLSCKKIATILDLSVDQVKKAHTNALRKLRSSKLKNVFSDQLGEDQSAVDEAEIPIIDVDRALLDAEDLLISEIDF